MNFDDKKLSKAHNNFDLLRLCASLMILIGHAPLLLTGKYYQNDPFIFFFDHGVHSFGLVIFFVISGYLVARSWEKRPAIVSFLRARIVRMFPGLIVMTVLFVFVIGPLLTTTNLQTYFSSASTYKYLANATLVRITYQLPGVFEGNPIGSGVNGSLWSLPYEFFCYFIVLGIGVSGLLKKSKFIYPILLLFAFCSYLLFQDKLNEVEIPIIALRVRVFAQFLLYYLAGASYYHLRHFIPLNGWGALISVTFCTLLHVFKITDLWGVFVLPYFILYLALGCRPVLGSILKKGDLSFGICLYAFPLQQILVYFFPDSFQLVGYIFLTIVLVLPIAYLSWNLVEKRALRWK